MIKYRRAVSPSSPVTIPDPPDPVLPLALESNLDHLHPHRFGR